MERLLKKYADKLVAAGLASREGPGRVLMAGLDDALVWNIPAEPGALEEARRATLEAVFAGLNINSLCYAAPAEPYRSIIGFLAARSAASGGVIQPQDCETRTFLHDLPVVGSFSSQAIVAALKRRKTVIVHDPAADGPVIVTSGTVSPEQAFVFFSSVCFACFVKFFVDYLHAAQQGSVDREAEAVFKRVRGLLPPLASAPPELARAPFSTPAQVLAALCEAGRQTVAYGLVDSYFGNISYLHEGTLYISQTGSSLDELEGHIDPCPLDDSSTAGITASSELSAHVATLGRTGMRALLHGHPRFSVILSMDCAQTDCARRGECHIRCPEKRVVCGTPVAPGEVGTGPYGLCHTLPEAMGQGDAAIIYGHGLFTAARDDFNAAFARLLGVEAACREEYFRRVNSAG